jgi:hypothetical protein
MHTIKKQIRPLGTEAHVHLRMQLYSQTACDSYNAFIARQINAVYVGLPCLPYIEYRLARPTYQFKCSHISISRLKTSKVLVHNTMLLK